MGLRIEFKALGPEKLFIFLLSGLGGYVKRKALGKKSCLSFDYQALGGDVKRGFGQKIVYPDYVE